MRRCLPFAVCLLGPALARAGVIEVEIGRSIARSFEQVRADGYAYGPKQSFDEATGETRIWLPYGNNPQLYAELRGVATDPTADGLALFHSLDGATNAALTYQLHFNRPIGSFRFFVGWAEVGLRANTEAGVEYSLDGRTWVNLVRVKGERNGAIEPLAAHVQAEGLRTETLWLRCYSRDPAAPEDRGEGRWLKFRMTGDPRWGDAATTFFTNQLQLAATEATGAAPATPAPPPSPTLPRSEPPQPLSGEASPAGGAFGVASGAEWSGEHARLFPLLREAGVTVVRSFPEWGGLQPRPGEWQLAGADALVASARANGIELVGLLAYLAPWASSAPPGADHGESTRTFPVKDMQAWRDYVRGVVTRYGRDIRCWEVYNEFNSRGFARNATIKDYVELVRDAWTTIKAIDPGIQVGIGCADVDLSFLENVIWQGGSGHFDFVNVHPYSLMDAAMAGREPIFLRLGENLRKMLAKTRQRPDIALWVSEIGRQAVNQPEPERLQAEAVVKAFALCLAQGLERVLWFEGRGPSYGAAGDFGLLRADWTKRPAWQAFATQTKLLGARPDYLGWLDPTGASYGFVFAGTTGPTLVTWAAGEAGEKLTFPGAVTVTDLLGQTTRLAAGATLALTRSPVFVTELPAATVAEARSHRDRPFPWLADFGGAAEVSCVMGAANVTQGVTQLERGDGITVVDLVDGVHARRTDKARQRPYIYFDVDDSYAGIGDRELAITVIARRLADDRETGCNLVYESLTGYRNLGQWWSVPAGGWHEHTFRLTDANFANNWGWNFRIETVASPDDLWVREVRVKRLGEKR